MQKLLVAMSLFALLGASAVVGADTSSNRPDVAGLTFREYTVDVPLGHAVVFTSGVNGVTLTTVPIADLPYTVNNHNDGVAGCVNSRSWVRDLSEGPCGAYQFHAGALSEVTLASTGPGTFYADALDLFSWAYWFVSCSVSSPAYVGGVAGTATCFESGSPAGISNWDGLVGYSTQRAFAAVYA